MNKDQREPYLILNSIELPDGANVVLCSWCKYAEWWGCCGDGGVNCKHPLWRISEYSDNTCDYGYDCWGFRPKVAKQDAVDIVGIYLQGKAVDWDTVPLIRRRQFPRERAPS